MKAIIEINEKRVRANPALFSVVHRMLDQCSQCHTLGPECTTTANADTLSVIWSSAPPGHLGQEVQLGP